MGCSPPPMPFDPSSPPPWLLTRLNTYARTVASNPLIPCRPTARQALFLLFGDVREALYGGAAGGGKSSAALMGAVQYAHVPGHAALILRRSFGDLMQADGLIPRSKDWWGGNAHWSP